MRHWWSGFLTISTLVLLAGCVSAVRTEGTSPPIAWRVTDMATVTRNIQGQAVDTYDFTLVIRNVGDRRLLLTKMNRTIYQAGGGQPGHSSATGRWDLGPGGEWKFPLYSYTFCVASQGCIERGSQAPMWQIVLTGTDDGNAPVESRFEIILPPRPAKLVDTGAVRRAPTSSEPPPGARTTAAPTPASTQSMASAPGGDAGARLSIELPVWRPGFEWEYRWDGPAGNGTFVWSVTRLEPVDGDDYFVIRASSGREIYWRARDRAYLMDKVSDGIEFRRVPPTTIPWPLVVGKSWESRYVGERPIAKSSQEEVRSCLVEKQERIIVPAGTFETLKVVCTDPRNREVVGETWFAPEVRNMVKDRSKFDEGVRDRELLRYRLE